MDVEELGSDDAARQVFEYRTYYRDIKRLMIVCGAWPGLRRISQIFLSCFAISMLSVTFVGMLGFTIHYISNITVFTQSIGLCISIFSSMMKITICVMNRDKLASLNTHLGARYTEDLECKDYQPLALYRYRTLSKLFYSLRMVIGMTSVFNAVLMPLLALKRGKYVHGLPSKFPFTYEPGSLIFWGIQVAHTSTSFYVWVVTSGVDSVFGLYTLQMCGELRILAYEFQNLKMSTNYRAKLRECIGRHTLVMRSKDSLERIFGFLVIWLAITSAIIQCTFIFQATELLKTMDFTKILHQAGLIMLKLLQAYIYALYGSIINEESTICLDSMYNAAWAESGNRRFMTDVLVVVSQKPFMFRAKGCLNLTMELFSKIVNTSVSYFFLLQTLDSGSEN